MRTLLTAAFLLSALSVQAAPPIEFKGLSLGASKQELLSKFPSLECVKPGEQFWQLGDEHCTDKGFGEALQTYAGMPAWDQTFSIIDGRVEQFSLVVHPRSYEDIRNTLIQALGRGSEDSRQVQMRSGAKFASRTWEVATDTGTLSLFEHAGKISEGYVTGSSKVRERWLKSRASGNAQKGAKDI